MARVETEVQTESTGGPHSDGFWSHRHTVRQSLALVWAAARRDLVVIVVLQSLAAGILIAQLLIGRELLRAGLTSETDTSGLDLIIPELVVLVVITGIAGVASAASNGRRTIGAMLVERAALERVLRRAAQASLNDFDEPTFHDRLRRAEESALERPWQLVSGLVGLISSSMSIAAIAVAITVIEPALAVVAILAYLPLGLAMRRNSAGSAKLSLQYTEEERERFYLQGVLVGRRPAAELRNYLLTGPLLARFGVLYDTALARRRELHTKQMRRSLAANAASSVVIAGAILLVAMLADRSDDWNIADAGIAAIAIAQLGVRLRVLSTSSAGLYESTLFLSDYFSFAPAQESRQSAAERSQTNVQPFNHLVLDNIGFSYPHSTRFAVRGIDLRITAGEVIALVGPSGSGKTTLVKLIAGLYDPTEGSMHWDDTVASALTASERAARTTVVFQDFTRFEVSARFNVAAAAVERIDEEGAIEIAAEVGGIHRTLSELPSGYDTYLSPAYRAGTDLSEGQWQRLAIARAAFRPTPVIILDEPTASLDARAERRALDSIRDRWSGQTVILVTHRIANACMADRVVVLDQGSIVEVGTPEALIQSDGIFAEFAELQGVTLDAAPAGEL